MSRDTLDQEAFINAVGKRKMNGQQSGALRIVASTEDANSNSGSKSRNVKSMGAVVDAVSHSNIERQHFYLHRPNLPSNFRCVIPLQPDATIKDVLRDRVLIEFPTIFVSATSKDKLQPPFITEEEHIKNRGNQSIISAPEAQKLRCIADGIDEQFTGPHPPPELDKEKMEDVTQIDLQR